MTMFKDFKCPNGLSPEDCRHIPQLLINMKSYFEHKATLRAASLSNEDSLEAPKTNQSTNQNPTHQTQKTRG